MSIKRSILFFLLYCQVILVVCQQRRSRIKNFKAGYYELFHISSYPVNPRNDPSLAVLSQLCPKDGLFASFERNHSLAVSILAERFKGIKEEQSLLSQAKEYFEDGNVHSKVWYSALLQVQLQRQQDPFQNLLAIAGPFHLFPTTFFPSDMLKPNTQKCNILDENIGQDNGIENALWYFREDVVLNAHHWIWHLIWPDREFFHANRRRGELFSFFHHDILARYAAERLANGLKPNVPLDLKLTSVIEQGYNPHLVDGIASRAWATRPPYQEIIRKVTNKMLLTNFTSNKFRVVEAIRSGVLSKQEEDEWFPIHTADHINIIGELAEGTVNSINQELYGDRGYHNNGHVIISELTGNSTPGTFGVMRDVATAMRDPAFYNHHQFVDDLFVEYKLTHLAPYRLYDGENNLICPGVTLIKVKIIPDGNNPERRPNYLFTFWNTTTIFLENGLDLEVPATNGTQTPPPPINVTVCAKHLDHEEFYYDIKIHNEKPIPVEATIRIFLAPRYKSLKTMNRYTMTEQRNLFFTLDSYSVELLPGHNFLRRRSIDSTLTAPWPKSIREIQESIAANNTEATKCSCGFPHHLLLPKGTEDGMVFDLFVIVTEGSIAQNGPFESDDECTPSHVHCGIQGAPYPDLKPMGYPFDRRPFEIPYYFNQPDGSVKVKPIPVSVLEEYVKFIPNAFTTQIVITHHNVQYGHPSPT